MRAALTIAVLLLSAGSYCLFDQLPPLVIVFAYVVIGLIVSILVLLCRH